MNAPFAIAAIDSGTLLAARTIEPEQVPNGFAGGVSSRRLDFVTDPREWSFEMRKDAALVTLELSEHALGDGFEMKDASAFNVLFEGCRPRFIDHGSFRDSYSGHWPGYSQFGDHFMNPLLIEAGAGVPTARIGFGVDGVPLDVATAALRGTGRLKKGTMAWVWRRGMADRVSKKVDADAGERLAAAELPRATVQGMLRKARTVVEGLSSATPSFWRDYESASCPYDAAESAKKRALVDEWARLIDTRRCALDVGCNVGTFSETLAGHFDRVIAIDNDSVAIDLLYRRAGTAPWGDRVTPAVVDMAQPTPAMGWMNRERQSFLERLGVVDLSVWLAVLHHLMLSGGIPLSELVALMGRISRFAIAEHIAPEDQSVRSMTAGRRWARVPDVRDFEAELDQQGLAVLRSEKTSETRTLMLLECPG